MRKEEINLAVAEACGWLPPGNAIRDAHVAAQSEHIQFAAKYNAWWLRPNQTLASINLAPNYCDDLNAMHEAEATLQPKGIYPEHFAAKLMEIVPRRKTTISGQRVSHMSHYFDLIHATAAQRAEAFLKTLGKWNQDQPPPSQ